MLRQASGPVSRGTVRLCQRHHISRYGLWVSRHGDGPSLGKVKKIDAIAPLGYFLDKALRDMGGGGYLEFGR